MKTKKIASLITSVILVLSLFGTIAYAANPYNTVWKSSDESVEKFNAYIASLPEETAELILADEELVFTMKLDSYWEEPTETKQTRAVTASIPLSSYPHGSFYTYNGAACTCHANCTYSLPREWTGATNRCYNTSTGASGNCKRYEATGSIQCKAFADYVYKQYTGSDISSSTQVSVTGYSSIANTAAGADKMEDFFSALPVGSNVRVSVRNASYNHSVIISAKSSTGVTIYDANRIGKCKVGNQTKTWEELASMYDGIVNAWEA